MSPTEPVAQILVSPATSSQNASAPQNVSVDQPHDHVGSQPSLTLKRSAPSDSHAFVTGSSEGSPTPKRPARIGQSLLRPTFISPTSSSRKGVAETTEQILRSNEYTYEPLDKDLGEQIRILRINSAKGDEALTCALVPAKRTVEYEALSYYWGNDEPSHEIKIFTYQKDGDIRKSVRKIKPLKFFIRTNLYMALLALRDPDTDVDLWVDAVCINQDDDAEKKAQVANMEETYSRAKRFLIWLGPSTPSSDIAFPFVRELCELRGFDSLLHPDHSEKWEALAQLMKNVWFSRRWVVQELALAKEASLHSGREGIHWDDFADAIAFFALKYDTIKRFPRGSQARPQGFDPVREISKLGPNVLVDATSNLFRRSDNGEIIERRQTLETLISTLTAYEASDPRDTIYAILSLAKDTTRINEVGTSLPREHGIRPDYEKDLMEVCKDFVESCYKCSDSIDILCRHWAPIPRKFTKLESQELKRGLTLEQKNWSTKRRLASWMPSISGAPYGAPQDGLSGRVHGDSLVGEPNRQNYNASYYKSAETYVTFGETDEDPILRANRYACKIPNTTNSPLPTPGLPRKVSDGTMTVTGIRIDTLEDVGSRSINGVISRESLKIGGWDQDPPNLDVPDPPEELWRTMVADRGPGGTNAPKWYLRACRHCFALRTMSGDINTQYLIDQDRDSIVVEFLKRVSEVIWNRSFFRTSGEGLDKKARLGLASFDARAGDIVCVIHGCSVPVLLRKTRDGQFTFVGECYLHGMMDGEVALHVKRKELEKYEEKFVLR